MVREEKGTAMRGAFHKKSGSGWLVITWVFVSLALRADVLPLQASQLERKGSAQVELKEGAIGLRFDDAGWDSGVRIKPPEGAAVWDLSRWAVLSADVTNLSTNRQLRLTMHIASGSRKDKSYREVNSGLALNPGETRALRLRVPHRALYGTPDGVPGPKVLDTANILWVELYMQWPFEGSQPGLLHARIANLRGEALPASVAPTPGEAAFFPFVDEFGQYAHGEWPEKIRDGRELPARRAAEQRELEASSRPAAWDRFGGWLSGPRLEATGNFRTAKHEGRWWLVDPEGRLFFSFGLDVLHARTDATRTAGHERWFRSPVPASGVLDFTDRNLRLKYGAADYEAAFYDTLAQRLEHWGFNTIGNWGNAKLIALGRTSYTLQLTDYNPKLPRIAGSKLKFYDVFDPAYVRAMQNLVADAARRDPAVERSLTDPFCIGYFIDNELDFGNRGRQMLGDDVMRSPADQASKKVFVADVQAKYGEIGRLNEAWETRYAGWEALLQSTAVPAGKGFKADSDAFFGKAVDQYFRLCRDAVKARAPHRLYLGCRFIATDAVRRGFFQACRAYCDVLSVNVYAHSPANFGAPDFPDLPVLVGEFHFGVIDRGMFSAGLCPAGITQAERALAFKRYLQGALAHPNIVGAHWFQFRDQPLTGRWDGEGYAIGFVDVADTPYPEMTRVSRAVGEAMYEYRAKGGWAGGAKAGRDNGK